MSDVLDFPSLPVVGERFVGSTGSEWEWDGVKWTAIGQPGPPGPPGPPGSGGQGITDGSEAAPGDVGEFIYAEVTSGTVPNNATSEPVALQLSPGDWDVCCLANIVFTLNTPASVYQVVPGAMVLSIDGSPLTGLIPSAFTGYDAGLSQYGSISFGGFFGPVRINITDPMEAPVIIDPAINAAVAPGAISRVAIWARRMR